LAIGAVCAALGPLLILLPSLVTGIHLVGAALLGPAGLIVTLGLLTAALIASALAGNSFWDSLVPGQAVQASDAAVAFANLKKLRDELVRLEATAGTWQGLGKREGINARIAELNKLVPEAERKLERLRNEAKQAKTATDSLAGAGGGGVKALATRLEGAAKEVKELRSEVARLPAGTTAWAEANRELNEALAEHARLLSAASKQGEVYLSIIDRMYVALGQAKVEQKLKLWRQEQEGLNTATSGFGTIIQAVMATAEKALIATAAAAQRLKAALMYEAIEVPGTTMGEGAEETMLRLKRSIDYALSQYGMDSAQYDEALAAYEAFMEEYRGKSEAGGNAVAAVWQYTWERIEDAFADAIYDMMTATRSFTDFLKVAWDAVLKAIAQIIAQEVATFIAGEKKKQKEIQKTQAMMLAAGGGGIGSWIALAIPFLQHGGIVTKPTLAVIGEKGPERVTPLRGAGRRGAGIEPLGSAAGLPALAGMGGQPLVIEGGVNVYLSADSLDQHGVDKLGDRLMTSIGWAVRNRLLTEVTGR